MKTLFISFLLRLRVLLQLKMFQEILLFQELIALELFCTSTHHRINYSHSRIYVPRVQRKLHIDTQLAGGITAS